MTKATLLSTINGFITSVINVTKHRQSMASVVDELYPAIVNDTNADEIYTTKSGSVITYDVDIVKSGNIAMIKGTLINVSGSVASPQTVFTWKTSPYKPKVGVSEIRFFGVTSAQSVFEIDSDGLRLSSALGVGVVADFQFITYITED